MFHLTNYYIVNLNQIQTIHTDFFNYSSKANITFASIHLFRLTGLQPSLYKSFCGEKTNVYLDQVWHRESVVCDVFICISVSNISKLFRAPCIFRRLLLPYKIVGHKKYKKTRFQSINRMQRLKRNNMGVLWHSSTAFRNAEVVQVVQKIALPKIIRLSTPPYNFFNADAQEQHCLQRLAKVHSHICGCSLVRERLALDQQYLRRIMSVQGDGQALIDKSPLFQHKIHFSIRKRVKYGQAIFVSGDLRPLGCWQPERAFRLKWTEDDIWSGSVLLHNFTPEYCEYKYILADWERPGEGAVIWEAGEHNRRTDLDSARNLTYCHDRWNMDKISLNVLVPRGKRDEEERYWVAGEINELGGWRERRPMKRIIRREKSQEQGIYERLMEDPQLYVLTYSFHTFRGRKSFTYAILKRGEGLACETTSRRKFDLCDQQAALPSRLGVFHPKGEIFVLDRCSTHHLACSEVTGNILVGSHLRSRGDLQKLREKGVASVLALQSERELKRQGFSPHYLRLLCQENGVSYRCYAIEDMNAEDFITKADGGVQVIRELLKEGGVYVYCSAGVYRSPQLVALYLVLHEHYSLEDAISLVRKRHPFARPSYKTLHAALRLANLKKYLRKIPI